MAKNKVTIRAGGKTVETDVETLEKLGQSKRGRQQRFPGTEPPVYEDVRDAAEAFLDAKKKTAEAREFENDLKDSLILKMRKHKVLHYKDPDTGITVELEEKDQIKVKQGRKPSGEEE